MERNAKRDLALVLGVAALAAGGWYAYRRLRAVADERQARESESLIGSYEAYSEGELRPLRNGRRRKPRKRRHPTEHVGG